MVACHRDLTYDEGGLVEACPCGVAEGSSDEGIRLADFMSSLKLYAIIY